MATSRAFRNPYKDRASSAKEAARFLFEAITRSKVVLVVDAEGAGIEPTADTYVAKVTPPGKCVGCGQVRELRYGWCHPCVAPYLAKYDGKVSS